MQIAIHSRFFGIVYGNPQQRNVFRSVFVRIYNINFAFVVNALKYLVFPFSDMETRRASLRSVSRFYGNQFNAIQSSLVSKEGTQLTKRLKTKFGSKLFVSSFGSKTDIGQILNGNTFTLFFSIIYNAFCNSVIDYSSRCSFPAREPFQQLTRVACAFALNRTANFLFLFPIGVNPVGRIFNAIRSNDNIRETEIHTDKTFNIINILFRNINSLKKVKLTFFANQICFALNVWQIIRIMANKVYLLPTTDTPQGNDIVRFVGHNATVISNASKWSKNTFSFLIQLIGISNLCYLSYNHLGRKIERSLIGMIRSVMEFEIIENFLLPSHVGNGITNSVSFLHRFEKQVSLFIGRQKFYFQRKFHNTNIQNNFLYLKIIINKRRNLGQFLPLPKSEGVSLLPTI